MIHMSATFERENQSFKQRMKPLHQIPDFLGVAVVGFVSITQNVCQLSFADS
jgi:hypothetical protein